MGKKDKKKDAAKKFALQAKKEAKADKKAQKRLLKQTRKELEAKGLSVDDKDNGLNQHDNDENDIDAFIQAYQKQSLELTTPVVETLVKESVATDVDKGNGVPTFPYPPRGNFTLTLCPTTNEIYMMGGEFYDGVENVVFDELLCWNPDASLKHENDDDNENKDENDTHSKIGVWKRIISPSPRPPARCSHSTVYYNNALYVFGGELASADNYHHYKDMWRFDIKTNTWSEIKPRNKGGPTPRSGHRALVWRHYMIIFGGFFEAVRETPRWFNDLHVYDFSTNSWIECKYSSLATLPSERSAFNFGIFQGTDVAFVSGGFSKIKNPAPGTKAEGMTYTDCWALHLKNLESGKIPTWEKISRKGEYPSQRSGTSCTAWKSKLLVFGGVQDEETHNHKVRSVFYDDLFAFDMERRRWFKLNMKKKAADRRRRKKKNVNDRINDNHEEKLSDESEDGDLEENENVPDGEATSSGWGLDKLRANMFAFIDADGNIVYEKIDVDEDDSENILPDVKEGTETDKGYDGDAGDTTDQYQEDSGVNENKEDESNATDINPEKVLEDLRKPLPRMPYKPLIEKSEVMALSKEGVPEAVSRNIPLPRINAQILVRGNTLFIQGGILEVGEREVTLDDCWSIDLNKREEWNCIWNGTMHKQVWKGAESDNESYISSGAGTGGMESDDEDDDFDEFDEDIVDELDEEAKAAAKAAIKEAKKAAKKEKMKGIREEIKELNEKLCIGDSDATPLSNEDLATFYARTALYWEQKASELQSSNEVASTSRDEELTIKEIKREGFAMARDHYEKLKPTLERLDELQNTQNEYEQHKKEKKASKKEKKKKDRKK